MDKRNKFCLLSIEHFSHMQKIYWFFAVSLSSIGIQNVFPGVQEVEAYLD